MKVIDTHLMFPLKVNIEIRVFFQFFPIQQGFHAIISKEKFLVLDEN